MLTAERVDVVERRVDGLEAILREFMVQTGAAILRLDRSVERLDRFAERIDQTVERMERAGEKDRREWNKKWGELANKLGTIVEDIVAPNLPRIARDHFGFDDIEDLMVRRQVRNKRDRSKRREFDVIVVAGDKVIINETKSVPGMEYIDEFIKALAEVGDYFPEYQDKTIIPIFASLYMGEDVVNYLTRRRVYAMAMGDETMALVNFDQVGAANER